MRKELSKAEGQPGANNRANNEGLKITPQFPAEMREKRRQLGETAEEYRQKHRLVKTRTVSDTLYVNGQKYKEKLVCPTVDEILRTTGTQQEEMDQPFAAQGGNLFIVRAAKVKTLNNVRIACRALLQNPKNMAAKHNVAAYRLHDPMISRTENGFCNDGDFGIGRAMRDRINSLGVNDVVVFMTRSYGGNKLGPRRFSVATELIDKVWQKLERV